MVELSNCVCVCVGGGCNLIAVGPNSEAQIRSWTEKKTGRCQKESQGLEGESEGEDE